MHVYHAKSTPDSTPNTSLVVTVRRERDLRRTMSAIFNFQSLLIVLLLLICTCTFIHKSMPQLIDRNKTGVLGMFWKFARIGERLSPYVSLCCIIMALMTLLA